jgi:hypothetical protein
LEDGFREKIRLGEIPFEGSFQSSFGQSGFEVDVPFLQIKRLPGIELAIRVRILTVLYSLAVLVIIVLIPFFGERKVHFQSGIGSTVWGACKRGFEP